MVDNPTRMPDYDAPTTGAQAADDAPALTPQRPIDRFNALPKPARIGIIVLGVLILFVILSRLFGGSGSTDNSTAARQAAPVLTSARATQQGNGDSGFVGLEVNNTRLQNEFFEQNRRTIAKLQEDFAEQREEQNSILAEAIENNAALQQQMTQMLQDFSAELQAMQQNAQQDQELINKLVDETRELQLQQRPDDLAPAQNTTQPNRKEKITQTPLGAVLPGQGGAGNNQAFLSPVFQGNRETLEATYVEGGLNPIYADGRQDGLEIGVGGEAGVNVSGRSTVADDNRTPFIPPLGFVRATLLNGVDALTGGQSTPSLARLRGVYKTAQNNTVNLNGCTALIEFNGDISTERAIGKPSRMTCVYPDRGVTTYSISGYVVDAQDGIVGIPGVFYEGDAKRWLLAFASDFIASASDIVRENEFSTVTNADGVTTRNLTGDEVTAAWASGANGLVTDVRDYLFERANRVVPFVRVDPIREVHLVFLSGIELRDDEGDAWSQLFDAGKS